jgi:hypothetical protein
MLQMLVYWFIGYSQAQCAANKLTTVTWKGDHSPRHVHVYRDGMFVAKWDLDNNVSMMGKVTRRVRKLIEQLESEGKI